MKQTTYIYLIILAGCIFGFGNALAQNNIYHSQSSSPNSSYGISEETYIKTENGTLQSVGSSQTGYGYSTQETNQGTSATPQRQEPQGVYSYEQLISEYYSNNNSNKTTENNQTNHSSYSSSYPQNDPSSVNQNNTSSYYSGQTKNTGSNQINTNVVSGTYTVPSGNSVNTGTGSNSINTGHISYEGYSSDTYQPSRSTSTHTTSGSSSNYTSGGIISTSGNYIPSYVIPTYSDEHYRREFMTIATDVPMPYNSYVRSFIHVYSHKKREISERVLGLQEDMFTIIENIFVEEDIPLDLKYLAVTESALSNNAVSRAGAVGLWQFMYTTGKENGLTINSYIDERRDPYESTRAAARYLKKLHNRFGDWLLVVAAYNCGPGKVNSAIRRSGSRDFWALRRYLPRETRGHVPAFIACNYWMNRYEDFHLNATPPPFQAAFENADTVLVREQVPLKIISKFTEVPVEQIKFLNPSLRKDFVPKTYHPYPLRLPYTHVGNFQIHREEIYNYLKTPEGNKYVAEANTSSASNTYSSGSRSPQPAGTELTWYTVKSGDNLGFIAEKYGCSASNLRSWNGISNRIYPGQKIRVYVKSKATNTSPSSSTPKTTLVSSEINSEGNIVHYTIKKGDTLWSIAKKFAGSSTAGLMKLNNLSKRSILHPGMVIKVME